MNSELKVLLHGRLAGTLRDIGNAQLEFAYSNDYLLNDPIPLSKSLALTAEPFTDLQARPFFSGLLPDDQQLEGLAQHLKVSKQNVFKLLLLVGGECAGAVSLLENGAEFDKHGVKKEEIAESELHQRLATAKQRPILGGDDRVRLSLAGAQSKLAVVLQSDKIILSAPSFPSTHILKPASDRLQGLVENEYTCMQLASRVGILVPETQIRVVDGTPVYQVKRYDRVEYGESIVRLHQEDICQALGVAPENKYESDGGPGLTDCVDLIQSESSQPAVDYQRLLELVVFNYLIGNNDAHAKNFSLLYQASNCRLAPAYDIVSTAVYPELNSNMAMKIGGRRKPEDLQRRHWERLVPDTKTAKNALRDTVLGLCEKVEKAINSDTSISQHKIVDDVLTIVSNRLKRLRSLFS